MDLSILSTDEIEERHFNALDISPLPDGRYAVPNSPTRLKVLIKRGKGKWGGWIFVSDVAAYGHRTKYGKQSPNGYYYGKIQDSLRIILSDPAAASKEYGRITGHCGVCGAPLENPESVKRGIGPVCATKMGYDDE